MYSIVLAAMLTTGSAAPSHFFHGCHGCYSCGGGNAFSYGCCGGCYGCGSCYGCCGGYSYGCGGCCGGYYAAPVVSYGCGCCGGVVVNPSDDDGGNGKRKMDKLPEPNDDDGEETGEEGESHRTAKVVIKAPLDVKVRVNGQLTRRAAVEQRFVTPTLERGRTYVYEIEAETVRGGQQVVKTEKILVRAGRTARLDFNKMGVARAEPLSARVTVMLPADAKLYVDGVACPLTTAKRSFETPKLQAGRTYFYNLKMEVVRDGETLTDNRRITMQAGSEVVVEFKNAKPSEQAKR